MMLQAKLLAGLLLLAVFSGCLSTDSLEGGDEGAVNVPVEGERPSGDLFGWVVDASFEPVPAVNLSVIGAPVETSTNQSGYFSFPILPRGDELVVIAQHEGFQTQSKRLLLPTEGSMRLNFTLEPKPVKTAWDEVLEFRGLLACQAVAEYDEGHLMTGAAQASKDPQVAQFLNDHRPLGPWVESSSASGERQKVDCGAMDPNNADLWEFTVAPGLAGVIVEMSWEADQPFAEHFRLTLEVAGTGSPESTLAQVVGDTVLRAQVNHHQAQRYFQDGGFIRAIVDVDPNVDDEEAGTGVAFAYQQEFEIFATAFYVEPPPATYSFFS